MQLCSLKRDESQRRHRPLYVVSCTYIHSRTTYQRLLPHVICFISKQAVYYLLHYKLKVPQYCHHLWSYDFFHFCFSCYFFIACFLSPKHFILCHFNENNVNHICDLSIVQWLNSAPLLYKVLSKSTGKNFLTNVYYIYLQNLQKNTSFFGYDA